MPVTPASGQRSGKSTNNKSANRQSGKKKTPNSERDKDSGRELPKSQRPKQKFEVEPSKKSGATRHAKKSDGKPRGRVSCSPDIAMKPQPSDSKLSSGRRSDDKKKPNPLHRTRSQSNHRPGRSQDGNKKGTRPPRKDQQQQVKEPSPMPPPPMPMFGKAPDNQQPMPSNMPYDAEEAKQMAELLQGTPMAAAVIVEPEGNEEGNMDHTKFEKVHAQVSPALVLEKKNALKWKPGCENEANKKFDDHKEADRLYENLDPVPPPTGHPNANPQPNNLYENL